MSRLCGEVGDAGKVGMRTHRMSAMLFLTSLPVSFPQAWEARVASSGEWSSHKSKTNPRARRLSKGAQRRCQERSKGP